MSERDDLAEKLRRQIEHAKVWAYANGGWSVTVSIDDLETLLAALVQERTP